MLSTYKANESQWYQVLEIKHAQDATLLLKSDHKLIEGLFGKYETAASPIEKKFLVNEICKELIIHSQIEDEIFYPAVQKALGDYKLISEACIEHGILKVLIAGLKGFEHYGEVYDAKVKVLSEYVAHHVKEEESLIFPHAKRTSLNMKQLGTHISEKKAQLVYEYRY
jgi:hemerythrin superfamily protein